MRAPPSSPVAALLTGLLLIATPASAQTIRGILLERGSYDLIGLGTVYLIDEEGDTITAALSDQNGLFHLSVEEPGTYRVQGHALGYLAGGAGPFELENDALRVVQLALVPAPIPIAGVEVETSRIVVSDDALLANGFYERMLRGVGQFLTPEEIEQSPARYTPQLLRGLEYVRPQYGASGWKIWPQVWRPTGISGSCVPRVWIDDVWVNREGYEQFTPQMGLEDVVAREDVKAIELYWAYQAPLEYRAPVGYEDDSADCGVLLIWTR